MSSHAWSAADDALIRQRYGSEPAGVLAARLGVSRQQLYWRARIKLGLARSPHDGRFTPGQACARALPVGSMRRGGGWRGYLFVKVVEGGWPAAWRQAHHVLWEAEHGPIPPGHVLGFRDGDVERVEIGNLELVPIAEWMRRRVQVETRLPPDLARVIHLKAALTRAINQLGRESA